MMKRHVAALSLASFALLAVTSVSAQEAKQPTPPAKAIKQAFADVNRRVLEMAKDFPEEKYNYRPAEGIRSFQEVLVHILAGNAFAVKQGKAELPDWKQWSELDAKAYKGKAELVAAYEKTLTEAKAVLDGIPAERFSKTLTPWMGIIEHAGEHYGQLVAYYRVNGMVPPESRKSK